MQQRETRLPDFLLIGAQKSGTTSLIKNLQLHPAVHVARTPPYSIEMHFFDNEENWSKGVAWYESHFDRPHLLQGEKTPEYLSYPVAAERIATTIPDAKLLILLRNPVERAYSQWNHYNQESALFAARGWEVVQFEEALDRSRKQPHTLFGSLLGKGMYARQLATVLQHFDRDQLFIGITERWRRAPRQEYERLLEFLGLQSVDAEFDDYHVREYLRPMDPGAEAYLYDYFSHHNEQLFDLLGYEIPEWSPRTQGSDHGMLERDPLFGSGYDVCFVTTCMGRLEHLQQSLPRMLAQGNACALVVDYSCPQRAGDWVEKEFDSKRVRVVRVENQTHYNRAKSRNAGALVPASKWVAMIDADTLLPENFLSAQLAEFCEGRYYVMVEEPQDMYALPEGFRDLYGLVIARPADLKRVGGYDEVLEDYGAEDVDLRARLRDAGLEEFGLFSTMPAPIPHADADRMQNHRLASTRLSNAINLFYSRVKRDLVSLSGVQLALSQREQVYRSVQGAFKQSVANGKPVKIEIPLATRGVDIGTSMGRRLIYRLDIAPGTFELSDLSAFD